MMIEDELLPKDPVNRTNHEEGIRRVVRVDDIEPLSRRHVETPQQTRHRKIAVLQKIADHYLQSPKQRSDSGRICFRKFLEECDSWDPVHGDTVHELPRRLRGPAKGDDADVKSVLCEREGLIPNASVRGKAVFDQHKHSTSIFLH